MSRAFKLDNLQTFKPHLIQNNANFKIEETEVLQCLGQPNETVHSPFRQFCLYLNFSFESDLNGNFLFQV